ncbi:hypothetical protein SAMN04489717_3851 [Actinopolymorpha singaporensis]|uniref:Uncharacterized protein n=1 Tax=Actinopolymorpha singaporensis TaxID=117157 RepID=A0A1H1V213_9ACTN|nr:hypothetical protein SAMN04489717_3851 [Actinopolymorpha singaporensis]
MTVRELTVKEVDWAVSTLARRQEPLVDKAPIFSGPRLGWPATDRPSLFSGGTHEPLPRRAGHRAGWNVRAG